MTYPIPDVSLDSDIAILGRKGGGKTYTAKGIVERLLDMRRRVLVLDPLGVWAGLRTAADGEHAGYPVAIFGGQHGDLPLDTAAAVAMADVLARENVPSVIDLSDLSKSAQQSFLLKFLHELRRVNSEALTLVLEEADVFAPQQPQGDDSKALHSEIDWIARRGRFKGFRLITVTQRPARLSKDVLTQCATLIAHKLPAPQDRDAIKAWVDGNGDRDLAKQVFDTLAGLAVGEAWVWSPEHEILQRTRFPRIKTLDTSATPKAGERRIEPKTLAEVDLSAIRGALAASAKLQTKEQKVTSPSAEDISDAEARGYERGKDEMLAKGVRALTDLVDAMSADFESAIRNARHLVEKFYSALEEVPESQSGSSALVSGVNLPERVPPSRTRAAATRTSGGGTSSIGAERRPLAVLAGVHPAGMTEAQWAVAAGLKRSGGTWATYVSRLRSAGYIARDGDLFSATTAGIAALGGRVERLPPPGPELVEFWASCLAGCAPMLRVLAKRFPHWMTRETLADALNLAVSGGTFSTYLSRLRSPGLIEERSGHQVRAAAALMEGSQ